MFNYLILMKIMLRICKKEVRLANFFSYYFAFFLFDIVTAIMITTSTITEQMPAVDHSFGCANALDQIAIFLISIDKAHPVVPAPISAKRALDHFGKTSVNNTAVIKQINAMNT